MLKIVSNKSLILQQNLHYSCEEQRKTLNKYIFNIVRHHKFIIIYRILQKNTLILNFNQHLCLI